MDYYASGVLKADYHDRLVAGITGYAQDAGIVPKWIHTPLPDDLPEVARAYLKAFRRHSDSSVSGLMFTGLDKQDRIPAYMSAITGSLVRNFIRARLYASSVITETSEAFDVYTCMVFPGFCSNAPAAVKSVKSKSDLLLGDVIYKRHAQGLQTVVYVADTSKLKATFGDLVSGVLLKNYITCKV